MIRKNSIKSGRIVLVLLTLSFLVIAGSAGIASASDYELNVVFDDGIDTAYPGQTIPAHVTISVPAGLDGFSAVTFGLDISGLSKIAIPKDPAEDRYAIPSLVRKSALAENIAGSLFKWTVASGSERGFGPSVADTPGPWELYRFTINIPSTIETPTDIVFNLASKVAYPETELVTSSADGEVNVTSSLHMASPAVLHIVAAPGTVYNVSYTQPANGVISGVSSATTGSTVTVTATPDSGYVFEKLVVTKKGSGAAVSSTGTSFIMPASDVSVTAQFKVQASSGSSGSGATQMTQIISYTPAAATGQTSTDVTAQYAGRNFVCFGTSAAELDALRDFDSILVNELEDTIVRAEAAEIPLTNDAGAPAIFAANRAVFGLDQVSFSRVYDISPANPVEKLTTVTVTVPKSDVIASGLTPNDVTIYHNKPAYNLWIPLNTLQIAEDTANYYYTVATDGTSPFGVLIKKFEQNPVPSRHSTANPTQSSPAPFAGIVAGLGAAAVLLRLRR